MFLLFLDLTDTLLVALRLWAPIFNFGTSYSLLFWLYPRLVTIRFRKLTSRILNRLEVLVSHMAGSHCCPPSVTRDLEKFWWSNSGNSRRHRENAPLYYLHYSPSLYCLPLPSSRSPHSILKARASLSSEKSAKHHFWSNYSLWPWSCSLYPFGQWSACPTHWIWFRWACEWGGVVVALWGLVLLFLLTCKDISASLQYEGLISRWGAAVVGHWRTVNL